MHWSVSIEIFPAGIRSDWSNVIHMTTSGEVDDYGYRTPSVWFSPNSTSLLIENLDNGFFTDEIPMGKWTNLKIAHQQKNNGSFGYYITVDGKLVHSIPNDVPEHFENVRVYTSNPWLEDSPAAVRNVRIETYGYGMLALYTRCTIYFLKRFGVIHATNIKCVKDNFYMTSDHRKIVLVKQIII